MADTEEGYLLLDLRAGRYLALNPTASALWHALTPGAAEDALAKTLRARFGIDLERAQRDVRSLIDSLAGRRLIVPAPDTDEPPGAPGPVPVASAGTDRRTPAILEPPAAGAHRASPVEVARAWAELVTVDLVLRFRGLGGLYRRLDAAAQEGDERTRPAPEAVHRIHGAVLSAAALYFKRAWCLQRSFAEAILLRSRGIPAEVVTGVCPVPFLAHAWVEIDGQALGENAEMLALLTEIDRR